MLIKVILTAIFVPIFITTLFLTIQKDNRKKAKTMSKEDFTVMIPITVAIIGAICALMSMAVMFGFAFFSDEQPHFIFYVTFGVFFFLGVYLFVKTLTFKVLVIGEKITVFSAFRKPYSFTFAEIASAVRQIKKSRSKAERIVVRTFSGKKLVVESSEIAYKLFLKKVLLEVSKESLLGF